MTDYVRIYHFYKSAILRIIRVFVFALLVFLTVDAVSNSSFPKITLFFLSLFLIGEVILRFKFSKITPKIKAADNNKDIYESFTLFALDAFLIQEKTTEIIKRLVKYPQISFILRKSGINKKEIPLLEIDKRELGNYAFNLVKNINGQFVTTMDIFTSYIFMIEPKVKLLFSKKLKTEEFFNILYWARFDFSDEENPKPWRIKTWGEGIGESWVYGWTLETQKYTSDLTYKVLREKPIFVGRKEEHNEMIEVLNKHENNNVLLVGEPGTGKTTLVETLCYESYVGSLPGRFYHQRILELLVGPLLAGTQNQSELETRLQAIIEEVTHTGNIIIFIPEFQNILGASTFHLDLSGALLPYLKSGKFRFIAAATPANFKKYIEPMRSLMVVFEVIKIEEPDKNLTIQMLLERANSLEKKYNVALTYKSIVAAVEFAKRYIVDKAFPGVAVTLLTETASYAKIIGKKEVGEEDVVEMVEKKTKMAIALPKGEEKELLLHLEDRLHERVVDQEDGIKAIAQSLRRLRSGITLETKPISFLFLGPTGVGKTETAKALASLYFRGEEKIIRLDMSEYANEDGIKRLLGASPGEGDEKGELTEKIYENPSSLVLLDEFEKANPKILDLFLQVLDDGRLTDNKGKTVSFVNTIIIATSNAASEFIREEITKGTTIDKNFQRKLLETLQTRGIFKPELLNRFDEIVVFKPLGEKEVIKITKLLLSKVSDELLKQDIEVSFDEKVMAKIAKDGFDQQFGARPLRRFIQDNIENILAQKILNNEVQRGSSITASTDENNSIIIVLTS